MVAENVIEQAQAESFKNRVEAMCRATVAESSADGAPPLPAERPCVLIYKGEQNC
jgi:hypothetical protein